MKINIVSLFLYILVFTSMSYSQNKDTLFITADSLVRIEYYLGRWDKADWFYKSGDDPSWVLPEYDHSDWDTVNSWLQIGKFDQSEWKGVAWLRIVFRIDSSLKGKTVGLGMHHDGASEIYLNGKKVLTFGEIGKNADEEKPHDPNFFPKAINFDTSSVYTLAVRISNQAAVKHAYLYAKFIGHIGVGIYLFDNNTQSKKILERNYKAFSFEWAIKGFSLAFAVIFILLYFFYSKQKENLFFSLFVLGIFLSYTSGTIEYIFKASFYTVVFARFLGFISFTIIFINLLLFLYQIVYKRTIKLFWFFLIGFLIINFVIFFSFDQLTSYSIPMLIGVAILGIETVRVIVIGIRKKIPNIRIIAGGIIVSLSLILFNVTAFLIELNIELLNLLEDFLVPILILSIPFSMAIYLAKTFAKMNNELEERIVTIQQMSEKQLEQERYNAELKMQSELNKLENESKTKELEQAKVIEKSYTELKATQAQLVHSEKMASLGELTAGIAHEIKNPLNFVNNFSDLSRELLDDLKAELENDNKEEVMAIAESLKQNLDKINQHGKRADSIVKGMLMHSRGTSGEKVLTNINDLLDQYVNLAYHGLRAQNKEFNITIEKDYDESLEKINVVPQDISRVFLNIINNACYAAYDKKLKSGDNNFTPTLKVSTKNLDDSVEIKIADNGNGIPPEIIDKIFQPFFTTKPTGEGTGLGLSLSYDIVVKQHGGEIKFESEEGKYTEFIITIPYH